MSVEEVWVVTNIGDNYAQSASELGPGAPCTTIPFFVHVQIPPDYVIVSKYEWFVNGVSVYINTTDPGDAIFPYTVISKPTSVYCKVTYQKQEGSLSAPSLSTTFTP